MMPQDGFESAQFLVDWASNHIIKLDDSIDSYFKENPPIIIIEIDKNTNRYNAKIQFQPIHEEIRGLVNNIVKDLRDALDQSIGAASYHVSGIVARNRHFPFAESPDDFDNAVRLNQCKDIPESLRPVIKKFEPYSTGDNWQGGDNFLRLLGRISGTHKHRFALAPAVNVKRIALGGAMELRSWPTPARIFPKELVTQNNGHLVQSRRPKHAAQ